MHIPWRVPPFEGNTSPTPSTISHDHCPTLRGPLAPRRRQLDIDPTGQSLPWCVCVYSTHTLARDRSQTVPTGTRARLTSPACGPAYLFARSIIGQHHFCIVTHTSVTKLCVLSINIMHVFIINHAITVGTLPICQLGHSSSS